MKIPARLEGGPFCGDEGLVDELPDTIWVRVCVDCGDHICWYNQWVRGGEVYTLATLDQGSEGEGARYIYETVMDGGIWTQTDKREPVPA